MQDDPVTATAMAAIADEGAARVAEKAAKKAVFDAEYDEGLQLKLLT